MCVKEVFVNFYILSLTTWTLDEGEGLFYLVLSGSVFIDCRIRGNSIRNNNKERLKQYVQEVVTHFIY